MFQRSDKVYASLNFTHAPHNQLEGVDPNRKFLVFRNGEWKLSATSGYSCVEKDVLTGGWLGHDVHVHLEKEIKLVKLSGGRKAAIPGYLCPTQVSWTW